MSRSGLIGIGGAIAVMGSALFYGGWRAAESDLSGKIDSGDSSRMPSGVRESLDRHANREIQRHMDSVLEESRQRLRIQLSDGTVAEVVSDVEAVSNEFMLGRVLEQRRKFTGVSRQGATSSIQYDGVEVRR